LELNRRNRRSQLHLIPKLLTLTKLLSLIRVWIDLFVCANGTAQLRRRQWCPIFHIAYIGETD
jgi:hypothetical protein